VNTSISYYGILYLLILVLPTLYLNYKLDLTITKATIIAIIRMIVQLSLVGLYLQYIFDLNNPFLNLAYIILMMNIASFSITKSCGLKLRNLLFPIFLSMAIPNVLMIFFINTFVIRLENIMDARYLITIGGMLLGNILSGDIIGLNTYYRGIKENKDVVNYDLALGATLYQASKPFLKDAINASIKPTIASMATIGLVSLPGMMTGQILGGSLPYEAIMYQITIMLAIYISRYLNIILVISFSNKFMFNNKSQLIGLD